MKNPLPYFALALGLLSAGGCFSLATTPTKHLRNAQALNIKGRPLEHVVAMNYGWYLFNKYPLVCGNAREHAATSCVFFRDDVTPDVIHDRFMTYAAEKGAHVADLNFQFTEDVLMVISSTTIPIPLPYILCYHEQTLSGVLIEPVRETPPAPPSALPPAAARPAQAQAPLQDDPEKKRAMKKLLEEIPDGGVK